MKIEEVRMKHLFRWCHNENPMTLLSKDAELALIDGWGSEGYVVAVDASDCSDELKFLKLQTYTKGLWGYGVNFSFLFLRFSRGGEEFFYPAVAMYMKRNNGENIEHFTTLEYYARRAMGFVSDADIDFTNNYTLLSFKKGENELKSAVERIASEKKAEFVGYALAPSPTHNAERLARNSRCECYATFCKTNIPIEHGRTTAIPSGFQEIDDCTSGWQKSDLVVIAGQPAVGKSAFALSSIKKIAIDGISTSEGIHRIPCALFSLEMNIERITHRLKMITDNCISAERLKDFPIYIDDTPCLSIAELYERLPQMISKYGIEIAFIDYVGLMDPKSPTAKKHTSRKEEFENVLKSLKELAKRLEIPIIAFAMQNCKASKKGESRDWQRSELSDINYSDVIEQHADTVAIIHLYDFLNCDEEECETDKNAVLFTIVKQHSGRKGTIKLQFDKTTCEIYQ